MTVEPPRGTPEWYDADYFETPGVKSVYHDFDICMRQYYKNYADYLAQQLDFRGTTVLDVGCAKGLSVEEYRSRGADAWGTDISRYAIRNAPSSVRDRIWQGDLGRPLLDWFAHKPAGSPKVWHAVVCIETVEHVFPWRVPLAITNLARVTADLLYLTIPTNTEWDGASDHVCIRPDCWWEARFAEYAPNLVRQKVREQSMRLIPFGQWGPAHVALVREPWLFGMNGGLPTSVVSRALAQYRAGERLYRDGKAEYDGKEEHA